jgi:phage terminase large subunit-like protein
MIPAEILQQVPPGQSVVTFLLSHLDPLEQRRFFSSLTSLEASVFEHDWSLWARPEQKPPREWVEKKKHTWLILGGRGMGKTRPGAETTIQRAMELGRQYRTAKIALIAKDPADARDVMLEGVSGILAVQPPWFKANWEPSKRRLTWPNGVEATVFSSETPDDLRGPQHHFGWWDEPAKAAKPQETWDMFQFGLRLGDDPQSVITGTPRPIKTLLDIIADPDTVVTRGRTQDNESNLAPSFLNYIYRKYKGTRLGRQELDAEILTDTPGALWTLSLIDTYRVTHKPELVKIVVGVDPGVTDPVNDPEETTAETGIVVVGLGRNGHLYILADRSERLSPDDWGTRAVTTAWEFEAEEIIGETNNGGDLVEFVVRTAADKLRREQGRRESHTFKKVTASRAKRTRAEPISAMYEQGRAHHVGTFPDLEDQMTTWVPGLKSPDRMDALVWGGTALCFPDDDGTPLETLTPFRRPS